METASLALQKACKEVETEEKKPSTLGKMRLARKSAREIANEAVLSSFVHDFKGLQAVVESFESEWKNGQNKVSDKEVFEDCVNDPA